MDAFMHRCLELAEKGRGKTGINPLVGAVLVRDGSIVAEGWHNGFGEPHAEHSLFVSLSSPVLSKDEGSKAEQKIRSTDLLFVNLEPCCHSDKKMPPCKDLIIERGIRRVVIGMMDPNPQVSGKGIAQLREAGIEVIGPVLRAECEWLNRGFISVMTKGRPWITLKTARTGSGAIAYADGSPMKITSEDQDRWSHRFLRARHDAILVGVETVLRDDPLLNTRFDQNALQPLRIILDPSLRIPMHARAVSTAMAAGTIIITSPGQTGPKAEQLLERGVRLFGVPVHDHLFDWNHLFRSLITPDGSFHGVTSILVEGGKRTWEGFRSASMIDAEVVLTG